MGDSPSPGTVTALQLRGERASPFLRLHTVNIYVRDQDRALQFYIDQLGFNLAFDAKLQSGTRWVAVSPPDGTAVLTLIAPKPKTQEYKLIGRATQIVFVTEDVTAKFHEWRTRGVRFQLAPRLRRIQYEHPAGSADGAEKPVWGGVFARFKDVDGNSFLLVGLDEVSRELERHRRAVAEKAESERRAAQEIEIATRVQARLFPQSMPALNTLEYAGVCIQARHVGGDYYDYLDLGRRHLGLVIGDIAGKGIAAALLMANLQANLRSQSAIALDQPRHFLQSVNRLFCENTADAAYATLFFAEYDDGARRLRYANCGHLPGLLLRKDGSLERLESTTTVVGIFEEWDCTVEERTLDCGDTLALYTDGITEAFNQADEEFGEARLIDVLRRDRDLSTRDLLRSVVAEVQRFSPHHQHDDITLVVARCTTD